MPTLNFKGKSFVQNHHLAVKYHQLIPKKELSVLQSPLEGGEGGCSLHNNLIIQGDNLKALKALLPTYGGKIKCIYIDPPYNTGNEGWAYNDNVNSPMIKDWLGKVVDKDDLTRHDKWLCMMMPRLKLLRELLSEDGVIFISIDDNEQHRLRMVMDEIFGETNFITNIIWQKKYSTKADSNYFSESHDFILCYGKNIANVNLHGLERSEKQKSGYKNPDNDARGDWLSGDLTRTEVREYAIFPIKTPAGNEHLPPKGTSWRFNKEKIAELIEDNRIWFGEDGSNKPRLKRFLSEVRTEIPPQTIWSFKEVGHSDSAKKALADIFSEPNFATPKPVQLVKRILELATDKDSIILDSFAGSGTTAHAVLDLNKEDGGNRKFILVEMEEYANNITAERVRRVINGVPESKNFKEGTGGTFSYFELGDPIEMESILHGDKLPSYADLARYLFYTATGEEFDPAALDEEQNYIGSSRQYEVYLFYKPDPEYLRNTALTLEKAQAIGAHNGKKRLVFAPAKFADAHTLLELRIDYCQLPFEIYKLKG